ncbi:hypothetical protein ACH5RR_018114 [Cinchona calisaya]|uniref:Uncharacterized protein n=1 Tax=Cinchona calisaya TaxID=153742 RepID=A0ABD2ZKI5_9GENT
MDNIILEMLTPNVRMAYLLLRYFSIGKDCAIMMSEHVLPLELMMDHARVSKRESFRSYIDDLILQPPVTNVSYASMQEFLTIAAQIVKSNFLNQLFSMNPLDQGTMIKEANNNSLNILDGEINKLKMSLSLLQTRRVVEAQTLNKHESTLINTSKNLLALKTKFHDLKSSADSALAEENVHNEDLEKLKKAVKALKNQLLL